ncbi:MULTISPECIES: hypothetical protein [Streptacidiphilus]|uniref:Uncharacterized protein n=2 Tax=Streptacidiphilus TaxID=228398 RepID=A0ABV6UID5_9ACTN|nr:hypothetical protein [Streptacidiphilus jeojiense]
MSYLSEKFEATEVICGVFDKDLANSDDVLAHTAEIHESADLVCSVYTQDLD